MSTTPLSRPTDVRELPARYRLRGELGRGAFTRVLRAVDSAAESRSVAIKLLRPEFESDPELRTRIIREGTSLARVDQENVMPVLDVVTAPRPFYVMPLLDGRLLSDYRKRGPAPAQALRAVGVALADGLAAIHGVGLVHRDLRPENVLIARQRAVIFDLGTVKDLGNIDALTRTGERVFWRPDYASPELLFGRSATPASDLYALGMILLELALGRNPFCAQDTIETVRRHLEERPPSLRAQRVDLPEAFAHLVGRLLAKDPDSRPKNAFVVSHEILETLSG